MPTDESVLIQLTELKQQLNAVASSVDEMKTSMREVITLDKTLAELIIHQQNTAQQASASQRAIEKNATEIREVATHTDAWINRARGAWWATALLASIAQVAVLGMISWVFLHVSAVEDDVLLLKYRMSNVEAVTKKP
jgi:hypothetical protein